MSSSQLLDELIERIESLPEERVAELQKEVDEATRGMKWIPNPGPQTDAYFSEADVLLYGGQGGGGKLSPLDSQVLTPFGYKDLGALSVGSRICATDGSTTEVIGVFPQGTVDNYRVHFQDGTSLECGLEHNWLGWVADRASKHGGEGGKFCVPQKWTTAEVIAWLEKGKRFAVPVPEPVKFNVAGQLNGPGNFVGRKADPYLLGVLLGDGHITKAIGVTSADEEILSYLREQAGPDWSESVKPGNAATQYNFNGSFKAALAGHLEEIGLRGCRSHDKFIPRHYLYAPVDDRWALLQGLMDTDGWAEERRAVYYATVSKRLADDVTFLVRSLGGVVSVSEKSPHYTYNGEKLRGRKAYALRIKLHDPSAAFRLSRKIETAQAINFQTMAKWVVGVEFSRRAESQCIAVRHPNSLYIADEFTVTHNTDLLLGLSLNSHKRSLIMRRQYTDLAGITERAKEINGGAKGFSGSPPPKLRTDDGRLIDFGAAKDVGDEQHWQGQPHDLLGFDEAVHFAESQVRFLMGWVRSAVKGQRTRIVMATNPPLSEEGDWLIAMFAPWLDKQHANPAEPGELRWFITDHEGHDKEVEGPGSYLVFDADGNEVIGPDGAQRAVQAMSRTFIPSSVQDNPYLRGTTYEAQLDALPEPLRSAVRDGNFMQARTDHELQLIPYEWVRLAQERWRETPPENAPMCAIGADVASGGNDQTVLARRHDFWFDRCIAVPGERTPLGTDIAALIIKHRRDEAEVGIDCGGGYGNAPSEHLEINGVDVHRYMGAKESLGRTEKGRIKFYNLRAEVYYRLYEALDPDQPGGSDIALPPDPELTSDLCAIRLKSLDLKTIQLESKENLVKRLGRSTDKGDATAIAWWVGPKRSSHHRVWQRGLKPPKVNMGRTAARRRK